MEAKLFQEKNAQTLLTKVEQTIATAKQEYLQAATSTEIQQAIANWQTGIDKLAQIPPTTVAGKMAQPQLTATKRDFQAEVGLTSGSKRSDVIMEAARQFVLQAGKIAENESYSEQKLQLAVNLWEQAINQLQKISVDHPSYVAAQGKLAEYQASLTETKERLQVAEESGIAFKRGKELIADWQKSAVENFNDNSNRGLFAGKLQEIINQLESVKLGTTYYQEAQELLKFAKNKLKNL